jgi:hypothetical protein
MHGAIPPLPQHAFMAWCSVKKKAQGQLNRYLGISTDRTKHMRIYNEYL